MSAIVCTDWQALGKQNLLRLQPYLPDHFQSNPSQSASPFQQPHSENGLTVASAATHGGGGPSHGLYGTATDAHLQEVHGDEAAAITSNLVESSRYKEPGIIFDILEELGLSSVKFKGFPLSASADAEIAAVGETAEAMSDTGATAVTDVVQDVRSAVQTTIKKPGADGGADEYASAEPATDKLKPKEVRGPAHGYYLRRVSLARSSPR